MTQDTTTGARAGAHLRSTLKIGGIVLVVLFLVVYGVSLAWASGYEDRLGPNIWIGSVSVAGKTRAEAKELLLKATDAVLTNGLTVQLESTKKTAKLPLTTVTEGDVLEYVSFDIDAAIEEAYTTTHGKTFWLDALRLTRRALGSPLELTLPISTRNEKISEALSGAFPDAQSQAEDARLSITKQPTGWNVQIIPGKEGSVFALDMFLSTFTDHLSRLDDRALTLTLQKQLPTVTELQAEPAAQRVLNVLALAPLPLTYQANPQTDEVSTWELSAEQLATIIAPSSSNAMPLGINEEALEKALTFRGDIERTSQNARFSIVDGRVEEFAPSEAGVSIDTEDLRQKITLALNTPATTTSFAPIEISTHITEPTITTSEVNSLGITEILGTGTSSYKGSPSNRIRNIRNGVNLLNGLLIAPGETISLVDKLSPFTFENGYLPELVIKGDRIEPEIGGGLCQIGTTTFRATMNSGLEIVERRNHSLVVSYYNDPSNHNPGTDATIYEPSPDYKFKNDTEHYVLFQAEMLEETQELRFTFWGTSDGRKGSYTPPVVLRWISAGTPKDIPSADLAPGAKKCQEAHPGADTTFTYRVNYADGKEHEEVFESHYRALPKICLVGPSTDTPPTEEPL